MKANINKIIYSFLRIAIGILIILFIIRAGMELSKIGYDFGYRVFTETAIDEEPGKDVLVQITENTSLRDLAQLLQDKGLIRDSKLFILQTELSVYRKKITPGVYTLNTAMTPKEMLAVIAAPAVEETESTEEEPAALVPNNSMENSTEEATPATNEEEEIDQDMLEGA